MQILINILLSFSVYLWSALSFVYIYQCTQIFHIAHAAAITLGAYFFLLCSYNLVFPMVIAVCSAIILVVFIGLLCEVLVYRVMRKRKLPLLCYLISSLGLYIVIQNLISLYFGDETKILNTSRIEVGHNFWGGYVTNIQIVTILLSASVFILSKLFLSFTITGKSIRAVSSNPELCTIYGISSRKVILITFGIGSALAASLGIISAMDTNMTPTFGFNLFLYGVVVIIIGGVGSTKGLVAGALLVATTQHLAAFLIDTKWMEAVTYMILILFLVWKPLGFNGQPLKKTEI